MPIDPSAVAWDQAPKIDPGAVKWDDAPPVNQAKTAPQPTLRQSDGLFDYMKANLELATELGKRNPPKLNAIEEGTAGFIRGAGSIGSTLIRPFESAEENQERRQKIDAALSTTGADPESLGYGVGKITGEVAGTAGIGGVVAAPVRAVAPRLATAIETVGMGTGGKAGKGLLHSTKDIGIRTVGGGISGGSQAGLANPEDAGTGVTIGGLLPVATKVAGYIGNAITKTGVVSEAAKLAKELKLKLPPSMSGGGFIDRTLEGFGGKTATAQSATLKNQPRVNELIKQDLGIDELSKEAINSFRKIEGRAYEDVKRIGPLKVDDAFKKALDDLAGDFAAAADEFPELASNDGVRRLQSALSKDVFDSRSTVELVKKLRKDSTVNFKNFSDPEKLELAKAQRGAAEALEDLIERNLPKNSSLLSNYKKARINIAKAYDVEASLVGENVDPQHFARLVKKGKPVSGNMEKIGRIAQEFKPAMREASSLGSVPGASPLDWASSSLLAGLTANPAMLASVAARPTIRNMLLSGPYQRTVGGRRPQNAISALGNMVPNEALYRTAPILAADP